MSGTAATTQSPITLPVGTPVAHFGGRAAPSEAKIVVTGAELNKAIERLAGQVKAWITELPQIQPPVKVVIAPVLTGGEFVAAALLSRLQRLGVHGIEKVPFTVSTRDGNGRSLEQPTVKFENTSYAGKHVLVIDDVFDSGATLEIARQALGTLAASFKTLVLCEKSGVADNSIARPDFVGITLDPEARKLWLSGAGMDMPGCPAGEADKARQEWYIIGYPPIVQDDTGFELETAPLPSGR
jgi:hypoxanthine-guanine phosphoribosyltransferase